VDSGGPLVELAVTGGRAQVTLRLGEDRVDGGHVSAILYRHLHLRQAPHIADPAAREMAESELRAALEGGLIAMDAYWLNHPHANRLARSKPLQLALAARIGLSIPDTRITDDPAEIRALHRRWGGSMVAKLVGGQILTSEDESQYVVYTTAVTEQDLVSEDALSACPAIYQRRIEKAFDLRVTVVGERIFACRIDAEGDEDGSVDWRRAGVGDVSIEPVEIDDELARGCRALMSALGLDLAGLDLIVTPEGESIFLEVNAAGQWLWVEQATGMPIAGAIAEQLLLRAREPAGPGPAGLRR
jgi:glutathione synthase/RimK-type ligase-like ATP-grasp enzyme